MSNNLPFIASSTAVLPLGTLCLALAPASATLAYAQTLPEVTEERRASAPVGFNTRFLFGNGQDVDLQAFLEGSQVAAGVYRVDVTVNRESIGRHDVRFAPAPGSDEVQACLLPELLELSAIDLVALERRGLIDLSATDTCIRLPEVIAFSTVDYNPNALTLKISVPQASITRRNRGYIDPSLWDSGVTAGFINYGLSVRHGRNQGQKSEAATLTTFNGFNIGPWRLRNQSTLHTATHTASDFSSNRTYAERDITPWKSQLAVGDTYDTTQIFDSIRFRGVSLRSDDAMLPDSQRGYAPVIRGTAETNATVEVRQNNFLLLSTNVSPGPFELTEIFPSGSNGDLEITIVEADGRRRQFTQSFSVLPRMVREGMLKHTLAAGKVASNNTDQAEPGFVSGTLTYGLLADTTVYGGLQWADAYKAHNIGLTFNTPIGAISSDVTRSQSEVQGRQKVGASSRLLYARTLHSTNTSLVLSSYRYSTENYRSLNEHVNDVSFPHRATGVGRARSRFDATVNQSLGRAQGSLYLTNIQQRYWNLPGGSQSLQAGYSNNWKDLTYNLSVSRDKNPQGMNGEGDTRFMLSLSLPLHGYGRNTRLTSTTNTRSNGDYQTNDGLSGSAPYADTTYSLTAGHDRHGGSSGSASGHSRTDAAAFNAGLSVGRDYENYNAGISGSIVAHAGGINLGHTVGETFALIEAAGVPNAPISGYESVTTGQNGFAIVPHVTAYRSNWIGLDTRDLGPDVEIETSSQQVIPRRGSVTQASFTTKQGRRVQFSLQDAQGRPLPFGAVVVNDAYETLAVVDPMGRALMLVDSDKGHLKVKRGNEECDLTFNLPPKSAEAFYEEITVVCQ
ncbi:fimbria/pilus outer membrane usher protein [Pseudomonas sp. HR96]|uniref:fimbria/pilus outer membrane usher protein n=1 Tax=Pseudomonas sp. HR96 TaxID=1027966 RepID=UPI002A75E174|nr:fimbria/pilus outer membrane usher protein [Pseudomonas sp. HR96]WPO98740.1 fimbria/pilus outer membrane usher protein [Pseudomonas sp. HR96]